MQQSGVRRRLDDLGRIVLPVSMRRALELEGGDEVDVVLDDDRIIIGKPAERCTFCDATEYVSTFRRRRVCSSCLGALGALAREEASREHSPTPRAAGSS